MKALDNLPYLKYWQVSCRKSVALLLDTNLLLMNNHFTCSDTFLSTVWRFILGLGCGGVYPLAATLSAESASFKENGAKLVALTFSMQGVGYLSVPVFAWILISTLGEDSDVTWRLLLGVGAVPGILLTIFRSMGRKKKQESLPSTNDGSMSLQDEFVQHRQLIVKPSILNAIRSEEHLFKKLVGTAGCWFIFDILFYGNTLFQPIVLEAVFGSSETLLKTARDSSLLAFMALPAYFICIAVLGKQTLSFIQTQGFLAMSVLYAIIGITFSSLSNNRPLLLLLYGATFFFSDYGPNTTVRLMILGIFLDQPPQRSHDTFPTLDIYAAIHDILSSLSINPEWSIRRERKVGCPSWSHYVRACCQNVW